MCRKGRAIRDATSIYEGMNLEGLTVSYLCNAIVAIAWIPRLQPPTKFTNERSGPARLILELGNSNSGP
jgi:hypothetical protein